MKSKNDSRAHWRKLIDEFEGSGMSHVEFAGRKKLVIATFRAWLYKLRRETQQARFVEVRRNNGSVGGPRPSVLTIVSPHVRLEFKELPSMEYLIALVAGIERAAR